jgi:hypothetical protein
MFKVVRIIVLLLMSFNSLVAFSQYKKVELLCDCEMKKCDTSIVLVFNKYDQLEQKIKFGDNPYKISYFYNPLGKLVNKKKYDGNGNLLSYNKISYRPDNEWNIDSLFNVDNTIKTVFLRVRDTAPNSWIVYWKIREEETPSVEQRIVMNEDGNEFLNTTCYSPYNCITYKNSYHEKTKTNTEMWVMEASSNSPKLKEIEEYVLDENNNQKTMVKFDEKGDCMERYFYSTTTINQSNYSPK